MHADNPNHRKTPAGVHRRSEVTPVLIRRWAQEYVSRWYTPTASVRASLWRRAKKRVPKDELDATKVGTWIEQTLEELNSAGALDDARWARDKAESLLRRGTSLRAISQRLRAKGLNQSLVDQALSALRDEEQCSDPAWEAALAYARRRRFGPFQRGPAVKERRKQLASMARAGHSYAYSARIIDAQDEQDLEPD